MKYLSHPEPVSTETVMPGVREMLVYISASENIFKRSADSN
jgi:hypothetical protein